MGGVAPIPRSRSMGGFADPENIPSTNAADHAFNLLHGLDEGERQALGRLLGEGRWVGAGEVVLGEGRAPDGVCMLLEGWACRCKDFRDGRRQIAAVLIPGDLIHHGDATHPRAGDHAVRALTRARIAWIEPEAVTAALRDHPGLARALHMAAAIEQSTVRAWVVNLGQRTGPERTAHLFCELAQRLAGAGRPPAVTFALPLTQQALAWALGLTPVHVNRVLQQLRGERLIDFHDGVLTIIDGDRLRTLADFDGAYLTA